MKNIKINQSVTHFYLLKKHIYFKNRDDNNIIKVSLKNIYIYIYIFKIVYAKIVVLLVLSI